MAETAADLLERLGLSSYEARAYTALVERSGMTAEMVSERADVPKGRVYDVLNSLCEQSLARADRDRPKRFAAVEPDQAVDRLLSARQRELDERRDAHRSAAEEAKGALSGIEQEDPPRSFWTIAVREEEARELLLERFATAGDEVLISLNTLDAPREARLQYFDSLGGLLDAGVSIRLLVGGDLRLPDDFRRELRRLEGAGIRVRRTDDIPDRRFNVIDGTEACIEVRHPVDASEILAVINFRGGEIVEKLHRSFTALWREAGGEPTE